MSDAPPEASVLRLWPNHVLMCFKRHKMWIPLKLALNLWSLGMEVGIP